VSGRWTQWPLLSNGWGGLVGVGVLGLSESQGVWLCG
jgi:hypothetical protein